MSQHPARTGLRDRRVQRVALLYVLARVPASALWLSVVLDVSRASGSYGRAGAAVAAYGVGVALLAPVAGRMADRYGARRVLVVATTVQLPALLLLASSADSGGLGLLAAALLAGAAQPPLVPCMRAAWKTLVPDPVARRACLAFDAVLGEVVDLGSPLLAVAVNLAAGSRGSLPVVAVAAAVALLAFVSVVPRIERPEQAPARSRVLTPSVVAVLVVILVLTASLGAVEVGAIAVADAAGSRGAAGTLLAVFAGTSIVGGVLHARIRTTRTPTAELALLLGPLVVGLSLAAVAAESLWATGVLMAVAGLVVAPLVTVLLGLVERVARPGAETMTFTFASTANFLGVAVGSALAGLAVDANDPAAGAAGTSGLLVAAGLAAACLLGVSALRTVLPAEPEVPEAGPEEGVEELVLELEQLWDEARRVGAESDALAAELGGLRRLSRSG